MSTLKFSKLYLLSQREQRGLRVPFGDRPTVLLSGNGHGKSAVIKSLYEAFGASPHAVDDAWRGAGVSTMVEFTVDGSPHVILKVGSTHTLFDPEDRVIARGDPKSESFSKALANLLGSGLVAHFGGETRTPPPAYLFAPFYIDQDGGWNKTWSSFDGMFLRETKRMLSEYHSGLKPDAYYEAKADRDGFLAQIRELNRERKTLDRTHSGLRSTLPDLPVELDEATFVREIETMVREGNELGVLQSHYVEKVRRLEEERRQWRNLKSIAEAGRVEIDRSYRAALDHIGHVECPTCGAEYENSITDRFLLLTDIGDMVQTSAVAFDEIQRTTQILDEARSDLSGIKARIQAIEALMTIKRDGLSFEDLVTAKGRDRVSGFFLEEIEKLDVELRRLQNFADANLDEMDKWTSKRRSSEIHGFFRDKIVEFSNVLDVAEPGKKFNILSRVGGRGSERPRALLAYGYALLWTGREYGTSIDCPIVIDAPNQQGQDESHITNIMDLVVNKHPPGSQVVVATESVEGIDPELVDIVKVGESRRQVLLREQYSDVSLAMRPYQGNLL